MRPPSGLATVPLLAVAAADSGGDRPPRRDPGHASWSRPATPTRASPRLDPSTQRSRFPPRRPARFAFRLTPTRRSRPPSAGTISRRAGPDHAPRSAARSPRCRSTPGAASPSTPSPTRSPLMERSRRWLRRPATCATLAAHDDEDNPSRDLRIAARRTARALCCSASSAKRRASTRRPGQTLAPELRAGASPEVNRRSLWTLPRHRRETAAGWGNAFGGE